MIKRVNPRHVFIFNNTLLVKKCYCNVFTTFFREYFYDVLNVRKFVSFRTK